MSVTDALLQELDSVLEKASTTRRVEILRRVTDLFLMHSDAYSAEQTALFDIVMKRLAHAIGKQALVELSGRLAESQNAPAATVTGLAGNDDIAVAGPVLEKSLALKDPDLVEIAKAKSQKHLMAIAGRPQMGTAVSDVLVGRGNAEVMRKVTGNSGASISEVSFVKLINEAKKDQQLATKIGERHDLPAELRSFLQLVLV